MTDGSHQHLNPPYRVLLGPGPSNIHPRVQQAMVAPIVGHLDPYFSNVMDDTMELLRTLLISCGIAIALAGVAGVVIASSYSITPSGGLSWLLIAMVVIVLAGEGNINGVLPAGLMLGLIEAVSVFVTGASYREVIGLVMFILVLMFKPEGLFTRKAKGT